MQLAIVEQIVIICTMPDIACCFFDIFQTCQPVSHVYPQVN